MSNRIVRIEEEIKKEISSIILNDIKDPRKAGLISVMKVSITKDLKLAKVYISVLGSDDDKKGTITALKSAAGFVRREIGHRINLRNTPELKFILDDSIEHGVYITKLINDNIND